MENLAPATQDVDGYEPGRFDRSKTLGQFTTGVSCLRCLDRDERACNHRHLELLSKILHVAAKDESASSIT